MGAWGTGIFDNDTTREIWEEFETLYNKGFSPEEIRVKIENECDLENDDEYYSEIWTGIAYGQWMCGALEEYTIEKVRRSIDLRFQILYGEDERLIQKRIKALNQFINKIIIPKDKPRKRKKHIPYAPFFDVGDIIGVKITKEEYLLALVIGSNHHPEHGTNTIIFTDYTYHENTPTIDEILNSDILFLDSDNQYYYLKGFFTAVFDAKNMSRKIRHSKKINRIDIPEKHFLSLNVGFGDWNKISNIYLEQIAFQKNNNSEKPFTYKLNDLVYPNSEFQEKLLTWEKKIIQESLNKKNGT